MIECFGDGVLVIGEIGCFDDNFDEFIAAVDSGSVFGGVDNSFVVYESWFKEHSFGVKQEDFTFAAFDLDVAARSLCCGLIFHLLPSLDVGNEHLNEVICSSGWYVL